MTQRIAYGLILLTVAALLCWGWVSADDAGLAVWRRRLLFLGMSANSVSFVVFLAITFGTGILRNWSPDIYNYRWIAFVLVVAITSGGFGRGTSRVLTIVNALVLFFLWSDLAASSL